MEQTDERNLTSATTAMERGRKPVSFAAAGVVELRRYLLHPGGFPVLRRLFENHFIAGQQDAGMLVGTVYEDLDQPDRFVWWRAFADMADRRRALETFYDGPLWAAHRDEANATMIDSDDVLLLRHTDPPHGDMFADRLVSGPPPGTTTATMIVRGAVDLDEGMWVTGKLPDILEAVLQVPVSTWRTEPAANTFPRLPVRPGLAFVWTADFSDPAELAAALNRLRAHPDWRRWGDGHTGDVELMRLRGVTTGQARP
ncbi:NIPSNAP family protein [Nonomuraea recticatena]|uniref:NIPSNAP family protein n=1 Tax=Nonomuraea recticatena TaxID=46178 RepID=UPI0031F773CD